MINRRILLLLCLLAWSALPLRADPEYRATGPDVFDHQIRGEATIVTPFRQTFLLDARVRTGPAPRPAIVHPIVQALHWQRLLDEKTVPHRFALAKHVGCTPGAVTKVLRMIKFVPEIQRYLAALRTRPEVWHFSAKRMGTLAGLLPNCSARRSIRFANATNE